jgi:1,4-alpha-glucan branching enzyme
MVANLTPLPRPDFRLPVPEGGDWYELLNSDAAQFGGSGVVNEGLFEAVEEPLLWQPCQLRITLPPLGCCFFKPRRRNSLRHIGLK